MSAFLSDVLFHPLGIYVIALGAGFLVPLFDRAHRGSAILVFLAALAAMVAIAGLNLLAIINGAPPSISKRPALRHRFQSTCASACSKAVSCSRSTSPRCWQPGIACHY